MLDNATSNGAGLQIRDRVKEFRRVPASELAPHPSNWRVHGEAQKNALRGILAEIGFAGAALARELDDGRLQLIDGHLRAETLPHALIPTLIVDLNEAEAKQLLACYDPISAMAEADAKALDTLLREVNTGSEALQEMLADLAERSGVIPGDRPEAGAGGDDFDTAAALEGPCRVQPGELWLIDGGRHRLLVGDSTKAENVARVMDGEKAVLMNTDPPYGIDYSKLKDGIPDSGFANHQKKWGDVENDTLTDGDALQAFLEEMIRVAVPHLRDDCAFYFWHPMLTQGTFFAAAAAADILIHRQIIWVKPGFVLTRSGMYHWKHELCFYGWRRGNPPPWYGDKSQVSVWELGRDNDSGQHPTQKPVELFARPIRNHAKRGEWVYEPFAGSGSQYIAAHREGVCCAGLELMPRYCEVVLARCEAEGMAVAKG